MKGLSYLTRTLPVLLLALSLSACDSGNGGDDGLTFSGSVIVPPGTDNEGTVEVVACVPLDPASGGFFCDWWTVDTQRIEVGIQEGRAEFEFSQLTGDTYMVRAAYRPTSSTFADLEGGDCNADESGICQYFDASVSGIELSLEPIEDDFRVRVTGPSGFDLDEAEVGFCVPDPDDDANCLPEWSFGPYRVVETDGTYGYQIWPFPARRFEILAGKDVSGDGYWDFYNCYNGDFDRLCDDVLPGTGQVYNIRIADVGDRTDPCPFLGPCDSGALTADVRRSPLSTDHYKRNMLRQGEQPEMALPAGGR